jgi:hypothetical protein
MLADIELVRMDIVLADPRPEAVAFNLDIKGEHTHGGHVNQLRGQEGAGDPIAMPAKTTQN